VRKEIKGLGKSNGVLSGELSTGTSFSCSINTVVPCESTADKVSFEGPGGKRA